MGEEPAELPVRQGLQRPSIVREGGGTLRLGMKSQAATALCDAACLAMPAGHAPKSQSHCASGGSGMTNRGIGLPAL
jgi:hypothetical protein